MIDCSPEAQDQRAKDIAALRAKIVSGVTSITDRGRSIGYTNPQWLYGVLRDLEREQDYCMYGSRGARIVYLPMCKD